ncbi:MAG: hypothetical protein ACI4HI_05270, partial [Lachnospiraceae bacterium]
LRSIIRVEIIGIHQKQERNRIWNYKYHNRYRFLLHISHRAVYLAALKSKIIDRVLTGGYEYAGKQGM